MTPHAALWLGVTSAAWAAAALWLAASSRDRVQRRGLLAARPIEALDPHRASGARAGPPTGADRPPPWVRVAAAMGAAAAVGLLVPGAPAAVVAVGVGFLVYRHSASWETAAARRRRERLAQDLPHVVDLLASCLAVGAAPGDALTRVVPLLAEPTRSELSGCAARLRWGADPVTVWSELSRHPQLGRLGAALRRAAETGAPVVAALDRLAADLRARSATDLEVRVRQVEVRTAVPLGLCLLPAFLLLGVVPLVAGTAVRILAP